MPYAGEKSLSARLIFSEPPPFLQTAQTAAATPALIANGDKIMAAIYAVVGVYPLFGILPSDSDYDPRLSKYVNDDCYGRYVIFPHSNSMFNSLSVISVREDNSNVNLTVIVPAIDGNGAVTFTYEEEHLQIPIVISGNTIAYEENVDMGRGMFRVLESGTYGPSDKRN